MKNISCLCIEIGPTFPVVPNELIEIADLHELPVIIFSNTIRFIDVTQDLHGLIINRQYMLLQDLERISREFHRLTLTSQGVINIVKLLQTSTKAQVIYYSLDGQASFIPGMSIQSQKEMLDCISRHLKKDEQATQVSLIQWKDNERTLLLNLSERCGELGHMEIF